MTRRKNILMGLLLMVAVVLGAYAGIETEYASSVYGEAAINFAPARHRQSYVVEGNYTTTGTGTVSFLAKGGAGDVVVVTPTNLLTTITGPTVTLVNVGFVFTNNDYVFYYHGSNDVADYRTVSSATTNSAILSSALSENGNVGDYLYEVTKQGEILIGTNESNKLGRIYPWSFATPADSPLRIVVRAIVASNVTVNATVNRQDR